MRRRYSSGDCVRQRQTALEVPTQVYCLGKMFGHKRWLHAAATSAAKTFQGSLGVQRACFTMKMCLQYRRTLQIGYVRKARFCKVKSHIKLAEDNQESHRGAP